MKVVILGDPYFTLVFMSFSCESTPGVMFDCLVWAFLDKSTHVAPALSP